MNPSDKTIRVPWMLERPDAACCWTVRLAQHEARASAGEVSMA